MSLNISKTDLDALSVKDRLQLLEDLWESLRADESQVPMPGWHEELIENRLSEAQARPDDVEPWEDVRKRLDRRLNQ